jgi:hypothetical protein
MTVTVAAVAAYLREIGQLEAVIVAEGGVPDRIALARVTTDRAAGSGDMAWSRHPEAATGFSGALLLCPPPAFAPSRADTAPPQDTAVAIAQATRHPPSKSRPPARLSPPAPTLVWQWLGASRGSSAT